MLLYATVTKVVVLYASITSISYKFVINSAKSFEIEKHISETHSVHVWDWVLALQTEKNDVK